jgi:hypothetical protein
VSGRTFAEPADVVEPDAHVAIRAIPPSIVNKWADIEMGGRKNSRGSLDVEKKKKKKSRRAGSSVLNRLKNCDPTFAVSN